MNLNLSQARKMREARRVIYPRARPISVLIDAKDCNGVLHVLGHLLCSFNKISGTCTEGTELKY